MYLVVLASTKTTIHKRNNKKKNLINARLPPFLKFTFLISFREKMQ